MLATEVGRGGDGGCDWDLEGRSKAIVFHDLSQEGSISPEHLAMASSLAQVEHIQVI